MKSTSESDEENITILHLSDLHFNENSKIEITTILNALYDDLERLKDDYAIIPDFVVVSGDIAYMADQLDYNIALENLNLLIEKLKITPEMVFIVPGNHDINRNNLRSFSILDFKSEEEITKFLTEKKDERDAVLTKLSNFYEFVKNFYGNKNPYENSYYFATKIEFKKYQIGIVGLNTVWYSGERRYNGNIVVDEKALFVGEIQARNAYDSIKDTDLCITIMHHPFSWLSDSEEEIIKRVVMKNSHIIFHGHIHSSSMAEIIEPDCRCLKLSAGSSNIRNRDKRYCVCRVNLQDFSFEVYLRRFSEENKFWARDTLTYQTGEGFIRGKLLKADYEIRKESAKVYPFTKANRDIENFIKANWKKLIFTESYERDKILELRHNFFKKVNSNPSLHDIAFQAIQYLLENKFVSGNEELGKIINQSPFIHINLQEFEKQNILTYFDENFFEKQNRNIVFTSKEEIVKLKEREFLRKKEKELTEKIEERYKSEYKEKEQELVRKKEEFELEKEIFESKIDNYPLMNSDDLPQFTKSIPISNRGMWFDELGLKENPFPSHIGLESIDETLYNDIIVKTDIFNKFDLEIINSPKSVRRRSYLIYGVMGSGKTTLFKYLEKTMSILIPNAFAFIIPLEAQSEYERIKYDFYQKLYDKLETKYFSLTKSPTGIERNAINDVTISYLFKKISQIVDVSDFIIFIDDLHKHPKHILSAFEFISGLQIFRSYMYGNNINITIFLSGDIGWIAHSDGIKAIGGTIDTKEKIPEISIENAIEMINNRLRVFAKNPENPPSIKREYVNTVFKILKTRMPLEVTFRDVIEQVEEHWMNFEFDSLKLHEILDFNTLSSMMLDMESDHPSIKAKIDNLWNYMDKDEINFNRFIEIIQMLYLKGSISENDNEFSDNEEYYGYLFRIGLISKQRRDYSFMWVLTKEMREMLRKFEGKYGFRPLEYISKLYHKDEIERTYISEESSRMSMILRTGGTYGDRFLENIRDTLDNYRIIFKHITSIQDSYKPEELSNICERSIISLMKATLIVCENRNIEEESLYEIYEEFVDSWFENPDLTEFVDTIQRKEIKEVPLNENDAKEIYRNYFRAIKNMVSFLLRYMKYNNVFAIDSKSIYMHDKKILNDIRRNFFNSNYILALDKTNSLLKSRLIDLIYTMNCLMYGPDKWKRGLTREINEKFIGIIGRDSNEKSILNNLNLTDLINILSKIDEVSEKVFSSLFDNKTWDVFKLNLFSQKDLQNICSNSSTDRRKEEILSYIMQVKLFVEGVDSLYYRLFSNNIPFLMNYKSFGISLESEDKRLSSFKINEDIVREIKSHIDANGSIELDFSVYIPDISLPILNFVNWIIYIYHMNSNLKMISVSLTPNGKVIIS